jgi:hypothetical protein
MLSQFLLTNFVDLLDWFVGFMVFNATVNNISVISWQSVFLLEETEGSREKHRPAASKVDVHYVVQEFSGGLHHIT